MEISYDGANFSGWQIQANAVSVQEVLQKTARLVWECPDLDIAGSSRTDAGVHAVSQIAQLDFIPADSLDNLVFKLNAALPRDIAVLRMFPVKPGTRARFDAVFRRYRYLISTKKDPFYEGRAMYHYGPLDLEKLNACAEIVKQSIDFQAFSKVKTDVNHFECRVDAAHWSRQGHLLIFEIRANRFLRGMVRALVGTMLEAGKGKISPEEFAAILRSRDRKKAGENVPACGLYLMEVGYPETILLPSE